MKIRFLALFLFAAILSTTVKAQEAFVPNSHGGLDPLTRAVITGNKTGNSLLAAYGKKITSSLVIDGSISSTFLPKMSTVLYVLQPKNTSAQVWKLIPLKTKKKNRELPYMSTSLYSGSKTSLNDIQLMTTRITDEIYELRPMGDLKNGEYALAYIENGVPSVVYDFHVEANLPPYPQVSQDAIFAELMPSSAPSAKTDEDDIASTIIRWYFDSDPRGARIFYRIISQVPKEVKNTNESYMTTTPLEETKALNIPGLTYANSNDVVMEIKVTKRGYEEQVKRYNLRQVLDQQEISGFFELVEK